ncbi:MAG: hypothetical protein E7070_06155 [Bacteroidales bacterium]|jgi:hypothetical protein|nr:hypothetical protein [Bacteroidales bacterium]
MLCLFTCIDTGLFVYMSLSQTLLSELCALLLGAVAMWHAWQKGKALADTPIQRFVLAWSGYLMLHFAIAPQTEIYKLTYLLVTLSLLLSLPYLIENKLISQKTVERGWLLMLVVQLGSLLLQARGVMPSHNSFFRLTGCSENPNVTAMLLAVVAPLLFDRFRASCGRWRKVCYAMLVLLSAIFLVALQCRTAYIGLAVIVGVRTMCSTRMRIFWHRLTSARKAVGIAMLLAGIAVVGIGLYRMKSASADGRLLVWKISAKMVQSDPWGIGTGMFEHDYNLRQGEYFASGAATEAERMTADTVFMAYNDFVEQTVETGIIGAILLATFYILLLVRAYRARDYAVLSLVSACAAMSCVNFFYATIQPWAVLMGAAGLLLADGKGQPHSYATLTTATMVRTFISIAFLCGTVWLSTLTYSQFHLGQLSRQAERKESVDLAQAEALAATIGTSEAYWMFMHRQHLQRENYGEALHCAEMARRYTSTPEVFFASANCLDKTGRTDEAIARLEKLCNMLPMNLTVRAVLLQLYDKDGQTDKALDMAGEIVRMPVKIDTKKARNIKKHAENYINKHKKQRQ